jgi:molybdopterin biosynthesis enzyme
MDAVSDAIEGMLDVDVLVISGGSSVGDRDLVRDVLRQRGDVRFHGIAVKPGKPTAYARLDGTATFGMPGNPTSCLSNGYLLLLPFLRKVARLPPWEPRRVSAALSRRINSTADRHQFYTVRLADGMAIPAFKGSGESTSMADADGYIEIPVGVDAVEAGALVDVTVF